MRPAVILTIFLAKRAFTQELSSAISAYYAGLEGNSIAVAALAGIGTYSGITALAAAESTNTNQLVVLQSLQVAVQSAIKAEPTNLQLVASSIIDVVNSLGGGFLIDPTTTPTPTGSASTTFSSASANATTGGDDDDNANAGRGLSSGAKIGIGVGIGLGIPILAALAFCAYKLSPVGRRRASSPDEQTLAAPDEPSEKARDGPRELPARVATQELDSRSVKELDPQQLQTAELQSQPRVELPDNQVRSELDSAPVARST